jgi:hypothetical protein
MSKKESIDPAFVVMGILGMLGFLLALFLLLGMSGVFS